MGNNENMAKETIDYGRLYNEEASKLAEISYSKRLKIVLDKRIKDLVGTKLYSDIKEAFDNEISEEATMDEVRVMTLFRNILKGGTAGMKALELTYRLDGSLVNIEKEVDFEEVEEGTKGVN